MRCGRVAVATGVLAALLLGACAGEDGASGRDGDVELVATTSILGDIARNVVGDRGRVTVLMEVGVDPHAFEPSAAQVRRLQDADLVLANGLGLEASFEDTLRAAVTDEERVLWLAEHLDPIPFALAHPAEAAGEAPEADGDLDPHVWFDPVRMARGVRWLGERLAAVAPGGSADAWTASADRYAGRILDVHDEIVDRVETLPVERRQLVTNHDALGYFAARYEFEVLGAVVPGGSTVAAPSAGDLADLARTVRERDVPAIFVETTSPDRLARRLADEVGRDVAVVTLHTGSLGPPGSGAATYLDLLRTDAERIVGALSRA